MTNNTELKSTHSLEVKFSANGVATLTLNRPSRKNALDHKLVLSLGEALVHLDKSTQVRVIVLRGAGGAFCSGADLSSIQCPRGEELPQRIDEFHRLILAVVSTDKPVIAVVDGPAVGFGADLALACDLRLLSDSAYIEEAFVKIGLMPDGGGTHWIQRFAGPRAYELLALGTRLNAQECLTLGLANSVTSSHDLEAEVDSFATRLADGAPLALAAIKRSLRNHERESLLAALSREKSGQMNLIRSDDFREGLRAFLEKRSARFLGK